MSVVVLAKNEAQNLPACLASVKGLTDDIYVVDSGSTDDTVAVAEAAGATVYHHEFSSFALQRNWAIDHLPQQHDWTLHLDADERVTNELIEEIAHRIVADSHFAGFYLPSKLMLGENWLKYSGEYPAYQVRLFHRKRLRFVDSGHGQQESTTGMLGRFHSPYLHYAFSKGIEDWFIKHARYASAEATEFLGGKSTVWQELRTTFLGSGLRRRRALKSLSYRMPLRGHLRLIYLLIFKRGILDGRAGILYARMKATYESMASVYLHAAKVSAPISEHVRDVER